MDQEELFDESPQQLKHLIVLTSSLISISHSIKNFPWKWKCARTKLEDLYNDLIAIENCGSSDDSTVLCSSLGSIWDTLKNCDEMVVRRCLDRSFSGKLLMQSDLDILCSKLDSNVKSLCDAYSLGLQKQSSVALVVSRPSVSASKEDVRFYICDLLSRFKIGSSDMKKQAVAQFNESVQEDERYAKIATEVDCFVNSLVNFLDSKESEIQEDAAKSLCSIANSEHCRNVLTASGVIAPLIRVAESWNKSGKVFAVRCLMKLTENSDNVWSVSSHGRVTALLKICTSNNDGCAGELVALACGVLKNVVGVEEIKRYISEGGAVYDLVRLLRSKDEAIQRSAVDLLQAMAYRDESMRETIVREGGIRAMASILNPEAWVSTKTRETAFKGITSICCSSKNAVKLLMEEKFIDHLLYFLKFGDISVQELALKATFWLCGTSDEAKKVMGEEGFMDVLVKFLGSKSFEVREMAAEALSSMLVVPKNMKKFAQNDQIVGDLLQMLAEEVSSGGNKKLLLSILMSLTSSNSSRKKIERLAEAEVLDAKRIVRTLSSSKFRSILGGFWRP